MIFGGIPLILIHTFVFDLLSSFVYGLPAFKNPKIGLMSSLAPGQSEERKIEPYTNVLSNGYFDGPDDDYVKNYSGYARGDPRNKNNEKPSDGYEKDKSFKNHGRRLHHRRSGGSKSVSERYEHRPTKDRAGVDGEADGKTNKNVESIVPGQGTDVSSSISSRIGFPSELTIVLYDSKVTNGSFPRWARVTFNTSKNDDGQPTLRGNLKLSVGSIGTLIANYGLDYEFFSRLMDILHLIKLGRGNNGSILLEYVENESDSTVFGIPLKLISPIVRTVVDMINEGSNIIPVAKLELKRSLEQLEKSLNKTSPNWFSEVTLQKLLHLL